jgi:uridine nucleosidase
MRNALLSEPAGVPWLVATGALTNVALLFATFPEVIDHIKGLSIMGGAIGNGFTDAPMGTVRDDEAGEDLPRSGNVTHFAEFNIYCDPEAAKSIFSNPVLAGKTTLIPLDVTHQVLATEKIQNMVIYGMPEVPEVPPGEMSKQPSVLRRMLHDLLIFFAHTYAEVFDLKAGPPLHDPVAVAVLLHDHPAHPIRFNFEPDQYGREERWDVEIVTIGEHSESASEQGRVGATIARKVSLGRPGVRIPRGLDVESFWKVMGQCIERAEDAVFRR